MFNFELEPFNSFTEAVKHLDEVYFDDDDTQVAVKFEILGEIEEDVVYINEMYATLLRCAKNEHWLNFDYTEPVGFEACCSYLFEIREGKIYLNTPAAVSPIENIETAKTFVLEFIEAIENMFLSLENGAQYLENLKNTIKTKHRPLFYSDICITDFYKSLQALNIDNWKYEDLFGSVEFARVDFDIDVYYIKLYVDFVQQLRLLESGEFKEYVYSDIVDCVDIFSIVKIEDNKYQFNYGGQNKIIDKRTLENMFSDYNCHFRNLCCDYGEKGQRLFEEITKETLIIK